MGKETYNTIRTILASIGLIVAIIGFIIGLALRYTGFMIFNALAIFVWAIYLRKIYLENR